MSKYVSRYHKLYNDVIVPALMKELGLSNVMECPRLEKIVVNIANTLSAFAKLFVKKLKTYGKYVTIGG